MKKQFKTLIAMMLALVFVFAFASCAAVSNGDDAGNGAVEGAFDVELLASGNTNGVPEEDVFEESDDFRIRFVYSYTAKVVNANGRTEYKKEVKTVASIYVPVENTGFTAEQVAKFNELSYNGYSFAGWYTGWDSESQTPVAGTEFAVPTTAVTSDMTVYGDRGNLAGATSTWEVGLVGADGELVSATADELAEATSVIVKISGTGAMFDYKNANEIDVPWYEYASKISKVVIGEGITVIGSNSFNGLYRMKSVDFGANPTVEKINNLAFNGCNGNSFKSLKTPASLKYIGDNAFSNTKLNELVLNEGLETISAKAFQASNQIKTVVVPASLTTIGDGAFHPGSRGGSVNVHNLSRVYYLGTPEEFAAIQIGLDNTWFKDQPTVYYYTADETVGTDINAEYSYWHYAEIDGKDTDIPVQYCYTIRYFTASDTVTPIASLRIPVEEQYTYNADGERVLDVNEDTGAIVLAGVVNQTIIDRQAAVSYNGYMFDWSANGLTLGQVLKDDTKITCQRGNLLSNYGGIVKSNVGTTVHVKLDSTVENRIRAGVAAMVASGEIEIADAEALIADRIASAYKMWDFANSLAIKDNWGVEAKKVTEVVIADGVTYIGSFAFSGFASITSIVIPDSVVGIAPTAFDGCSNLTAIYYDSNDLSKCAGLDNIQGISATVYAKAYAPTAEDGSYWMDYSVGGTSTKKLAWSLSEGKLVIGGDSDMIDLPHASYAPWADAQAEITSVGFAGNIASIGENIVNGYSNVTAISLPNSVKLIPESAFAGTALVNNRTAYPNGMLIVDGHLLKVDAARRNTVLFETVHGIINIAEGAFEGCDKIERFFAAATLSYINAGAFPVSKIKEAYIDGTPASWTAISKDSGIGSAAAYFRSDKKPADLHNGYKYYVKSGNEYAIWGCDCVFGEWEITTPATCVAEGVETRYCIYDARHTETRPVEIDPEAHAFAENFKKLKDANCVHGATKARFCENKGCEAYTEETPDETNPKWDHYYTYEYVLESDGTYTCKMTCQRNCTDEKTYGTASTDGYVEHKGLVWNETSTGMGYFTCSETGCAHHGTAEKPIAFPITNEE